MEIIKECSLGKLIIKEIDRDIAKKLVVENHYSKKWGSPFGLINIGIFKEEIGGGIK